MIRKICFLITLLCACCCVFAQGADFWSAWEYNSDSSRTELTNVDLLNNAYSGVEITGDGLSDLSYAYLKNGVWNYFNDTVFFTLELNNATVPSWANSLYVYLNNDEISSGDDGNLQQHTGWAKWVIPYSSSSTGQISGSYSLKITNSSNLVAGTYAPGGKYYQDVLDILDGTYHYDYIAFDNIKIFFAGSSTNYGFVGEIIPDTGADYSSVIISDFGIASSHTPEPTSLMLGACGLISLFGLRRRARG